MAKFTVRVELHDASQEQYIKLHERMSHQGFTDTISAKNGDLRMPPAEYNFVGSLTKEQVLDRAKASAAQVVKRYAVLVMESVGRTWFGLKSA